MAARNMDHNQDETPGDPRLDTGTEPDHLLKIQIVSLGRFSVFRVATGGKFFRQASGRFDQYWNGSILAVKSNSDQSISRANVPTLRN